ncbi:MAG: hypoxanthine phosphoribosyltransferase [Coriobacteriia bacterium]|nr:hypoxanthine phosphoribosyltransferase [Coriobacteriia bacterium]MBN2821816.1 hypoxanthine phosphoribosyltransferase [Coriobacteriia bacterium]
MRGRTAVLADPLLDRMLFSPDQILDRVEEVGAAITRDYDGRDLVLLTVLRGGIFFLADLARHIDLPLTMDFMAVSSYAGGGAAVRITKDLDDAIEGRHVLVVEDIIDTGLTLNYLLNVLRQRRPASLEVCTLLDKDARRIADLQVAYRGFRIPDRFVVGYGLDLGGRFRGMPFIATLRDEVMG